MGVAWWSWQLFITVERQEFFQQCHTAHKHSMLYRSGNCVPWGLSEPGYYNIF